MAGTIFHRAVAAALATSLILAPGCGSAISTAGMRLSYGTDDVASIGDAVFAALRARRDEVTPPIALTAVDPPERDGGRADEDPLSLTAITADVAIEGPLAYTQLALTFRNPEDRTREGRFSITLPTGAAIGRFAMNTADGWREAEVVSRIRAREVYETYLHRGVDPALLEQSSGNTFTARVFPIAPDATTELVIGYSQEATPAHPPRLAFHGLPRVRALKVRVHRGGEVEEQAVRDVKPDDVEIPMGAGTPAVASTTDFVARVAVPAASGTDPLGPTYVLIDTSASRAGLAGASIAAVRALARGLPGDTGLTVAVFDQRVEELYRGRAGGVDDRLDDAIVGRGALGASDLGAALTAAAASGRDRLVLVGDAVVTAGETQVPALTARIAGSFQRVDVVQVGESLDATAADAIVGAGAHRGAVIRPTGEAAGDLVSQLTAPTAADQPIAVDGATWVWPTSTMGAAGEEIVVYGRRPSGAIDRPLRITVGDRTVELAPASAPGALVGRAVARGELAVLAGRAASTTDPVRRAELDERIRTIGLRHRLVSPQTSLLVLESDEDYARFCLVQDRLPDLIVVDGKQGLQSRARKPPAGEASSTCTADPTAGNTETESAFESAADTLKARADAEAAARRAAEVDEHGAPKRRSPDGHDSIQPAATGSLTGVIRDNETNEPLAGATVLVSWADGPALAAITDDKGAYAFDGLPPGEVIVTVYYLELTIERRAMIRANERAAVSFKIDVADSSRGETIQISSSAPTIDPSSTSQGITIDQEYTMNIPVPGRTFEGALAGAGGSASDAVDPSLSDALDPASAAAAITALAALPAVVRDRVRSRRIAVTLPGGDELARSTTIPGRDQSPPAHVGVLADVLADLARGDPARGVTRAARAQIEAPADLGALLALGAAAEAKGARALAIRAYGSMIDLYPGQAETVRAAALRLERLGGDGLDLALDAYARAAADCPDHLHGMRLWAWARARTGDLDGALAVIERALATPARHAAVAIDALAGDLAVLSAVIAADNPDRRPALAARLAELGIAWPDASSTRAILTWETDANDVDLHIVDRAGEHAWYGGLTLPGGGHLLADITRGYGPEVFVVGAGDAGPLRVAAHYYSRGPMGIGLGALQVIHHDAAAGTVHIEIRPFALQHDDAVVDLGTIATP